jgi:hypothetical protein
MSLDHEIRLEIVSLLLSSESHHVHPEEVVKFAVPIAKWVIDGSTGEPEIALPSPTPGPAEFESKGETEAEKVEEVSPPASEKKSRKKAEKPAPEPAVEDDYQDVGKEEPAGLPGGTRDYDFFVKYVQPFFNQMVAAGKKPELAKLVVGTYKVKKGNDIPADKWDEVVAALKAELGE